MPDRRRAPQLPLSVDSSDSDDALDRAAHELELAALRLAARADDAAVSAGLEHLGQAARALGAALLARQRSGPALRTTGGSTHVHSLRLPPRKAAVATARRWCDDVLGDIGVEHSAVRDVCGELVANAVAHAVDEVVIVVEVFEDTVVVGVWDDGPGAPRLLPYRPGVSDRGVGMRLVNQLSSRWGWAAEGSGKWVWARLPRSAGSRRALRVRTGAASARTARAVSPRAPRA